MARRGGGCEELTLGAGHGDPGPQLHGTEFWSHRVSSGAHCKLRRPLAAGLWRPWGGSSPPTGLRRLSLPLRVTAVHRPEGTDPRPLTAGPSPPSVPVSRTGRRACTAGEHAAHVTAAAPLCSPNTGRGAVKARGPCGGCSPVHPTSPRGSVDRGLSTCISLPGTGQAQARRPHAPPGSSSRKPGLERPVCP